MDFEFDNEIHALLQNAVVRDNLRSGENTALKHLDADDLAAFTENVLPAKTRLLYASHLAECDDCRKTLSNLILLQDGEQEEALPPVQPANEISAQAKASRSDWFKNLFVLPKLGFAAAGLAFLLIGTYAFVIYRETQLSQANTIAIVQSVEPEKQAAKQKAPTSAPAIREENKPEEIQESSPNPAETDLATITAPPPAQTESSAGLPPSYRITKNPNAGNKLVQPEQQIARNDSKEQSTANNQRLSSSQVTADAPAAAPLPKQPTEIVKNDVSDKAELQAAEASARAASREREANETLETTNSVVQSTQTQRSAPASTSGLAAPKAAAVSATKVVSGKTFRRQNNQWIDSSYNSQNVTTVSRNSNDFQKLDAGLRSIANSLNGEVIVVWQGKAYKIR